MNNTKIQAFLEEQRIINIETSSQIKLYYSMRGYKLDEIQISTTIKTKKDIEDLLSLIKTFSPCLE